MQENAEVAPQEATAEGVTEAVEAPVTEDPQAEETEAKAPEPETSEETERKSRHQRRKEALERYRTEAEEANRRAAEAERRLKDLEEAGKASAPPKESDYRSYEEYQAALSGYHAMQQLDGRERARIQREQQQHRQELERIQQARAAEVDQAWSAQAQEARTRYADFDKVALYAPIAPHVADIIKHMDSGADVAYQLGLNHAEAARISQLPPVFAAMELARIEARVSAPKPRTTTQAPDPIAPLKPKASPSKDPAKMTMAEYKAARAKGLI